MIPHHNGNLGLLCFKKFNSVLKILCQTLPALATQLKKDEVGPNFTDFMKQQNR
jgi:hypothetical protein